MAKKPKKQAKNADSVAVGIRFSKKRYDTLKQIAADDQRTVSHVVNQAVENHFGI